MGIKLNNGTVLYVDKIAASTDEDNGSIDFSWNNGIDIGGRYGVKIWGGETDRPVQIIGNHNDIILSTDDGNKLLYNSEEVATQSWVIAQGYGSGGGSIIIPATIQVNEIIAKDDSDIGSINFTSNNGISIGGRYGVSITDGELGCHIKLLASNGNNIVCSTTDDGKLLYNEEEVATQSWVQSNGYAVDLSKYYTKTEIADIIADFAKLTYRNNIIDPIQNYPIGSQGFEFWEAGHIYAGMGYGIGQIEIKAPSGIHLNSDGPGNVYVNGSQVVTENRFEELLTTIAKPITVSYDTYYIPGQTWRQWAQTTFCTILCYGDVHIGPGSDGNEYICYQGVPYAEDEEHLADSFIVG